MRFSSLPTLALGLVAFPSAGDELTVYPACGPSVKVTSSARIDDYYPQPQCRGVSDFSAVFILNVVINVDGRVVEASVVASDVTPSISATCAEFQAHRQALALQYTKSDSLCQGKLRMKLIHGQVTDVA